MLETVKLTSPDGAITFEMLTFETFNADTIYRRIVEGIGGRELIDTWSTLEKRRAISFASCMSCTVSVQFNLPEQPSKVLLAFVDFWERNKDKRKRDYQTIYEDFGDHSDADIYIDWCDAYNTAQGLDEVPKASPELQPGSTEAAQEDPFLGNGDPELSTTSPVN